MINDGYGFILNFILLGPVSSYNTSTFDCCTSSNSHLEKWISFQLSLDNFTPKQLPSTQRKRCGKYTSWNFLSKQDAF